MKFFGQNRQVGYLSLDGAIFEKKAVSETPSVLDQLQKVEKLGLKALVVRINSPGGTVGASQEIYSALRKLSTEKDIRVVASLGDVAASGGVYVAMGADYIFTQPGTVTGSIGVIIKSGNFRELLGKIGVSSDVVKSGKFKDILSMDRGLTDEEKALLQTIIDDAYDQFVGVVATKTGLSAENVKSFADGRIFSGRQALQYGLVDALGGRSDAVAKARELAGLSLKGEPKLVMLTKAKPMWKKLLKGSLFSEATAMMGLLEQDALRGIPLWMMPASF